VNSLTTARPSSTTAPSVATTPRIGWMKKRIRR
jgi:hypothetical protein